MKGGVNIEKTSINTSRGGGGQLLIIKYRTDDRISYLFRDSIFCLQTVHEIQRDSQQSTVGSDWHHCSYRCCIECTCHPWNRRNLCALSHLQELEQANLFKQTIQRPIRKL